MAVMAVTPVAAMAGATTAAALASRRPRIRLSRGAMAVMVVMAVTPVAAMAGATTAAATRDPDLGKVVLYQLSYSRNGVP